MGIERAAQAAQMLVFLAKVGQEFVEQPEVTSAFKQLMMQDHAGSAATRAMIRLVARLFRAKPDLILEFGEFLPAQRKIGREDLLNPSHPAFLLPPNSHAGPPAKRALENAPAPAPKPAEPAPTPAPAPEPKPADAEGVPASAPPPAPAPAPEPKPAEPKPNPSADGAMLADAVAASIVEEIAAVESEQAEAATAVAAVAAFEAGHSRLDHLRTIQMHKRARANSLVQPWEDANKQAYNANKQAYKLLRELEQANKEANVSDGLVEEEERRVRALALEKAGAMPDVESP